MNSKGAGGCIAAAHVYIYYMRILHIYISGKMRERNSSSRRSVAEILCLRKRAIGSQAGLVLLHSHRNEIETHFLSQASQTRERERLSQTSTKYSTIQPRLIIARPPSFHYLLGCRIFTGKRHNTEVIAKGSLCVSHSPVIITFHTTSRRFD
jgi:hypothetical protein